MFLFAFGGTKESADDCSSACRPPKVGSQTENVMSVMSVGHLRTHKQTRLEDSWRP